MEERRLRIGSFFEWVVAAAGVALVVWSISEPVQRILGPRVQAAIAEVDPSQTTPPGIPADAVLVPVLLLDGREIRQGDLYSRLEKLLPAKFADGPAQVTRGLFGDRISRGYVVNGAKFYVVSERLEANAPMRVAGIYLP